jgi:CTP:molybdopterin cytidylyltransferase MocA
MDTSNARPEPDELVTEPSLLILAAGRARRYGGIKPLAPIGPNGEAVIDLLAHDAVTAGFTRIAIVLNDTTGPLIKEHIEKHWDLDQVAVDFALQDEPHGTVHAVLAASEVISGSAFAVSNADDLYGPAALAHLHHHLTERPGENAMVAFQLERTLVGSSPVTRGVCHIDAQGRLVGIDERRGIHRSADGVIAVDDGFTPAVLAPTLRVSMNLWAFSADMWPVFERALAEHDFATGEVLLPVVVDHLIHGTMASVDEALRSISVYTSDEHCVGVTHPGDLELVQGHIKDEVALGNRAKALSGSLYR